MGLGAHVENTSGISKLKIDEKMIMPEGPELTIDRSGNRDGTSGFHINMAKCEHEFLNSEIENMSTIAGKRRH